MVPIMRRDVWTLAISLTLAVISLTGSAMAAPVPAPSVSLLERIDPTTHPTTTPALSPFGGTPGKMAQDAAGNVYVTDFWGQGINKFDTAGKSLGFIKTAGRPIGVAVQFNGNLVVSFQTPQPYVAIYNQAGTEVRKLGAGLGEFNKPTGVAIDSDGYIYVADTGNLSAAAWGVPDDGKTCVRVYDTNGNAYATGHKGSVIYPDNSFGRKDDVNADPPTNGSFADPVGLAYEKATNQIVVVDSINGRLSFFGAKSNATPFTFVKAIGWVTPYRSTVSTVLLGTVADVTFEYARDATGQTRMPLSLYRIYVAEKSLQRVTVIDPNDNAGSGTTVSYVDGVNVSGGDLHFPSGVLYSQSQKTLWVTSAASSQPNNVAIFGADFTGSWPPSTLQLSIRNDLIPHNTTNSSLTVYGTVATGAAVSCDVIWANQTTGTYAATVNGNNWSVPVTLNSNNGGNLVVCNATLAGYSPDTHQADYPVYYTTNPGAAVVATITPFTPNVVATHSVQVCGTAEKGATIELTNIANSKSYTVPVVGGSGTLGVADGTWCASNVLLNENSNTLSALAWVPFRTDSTTTASVISDTTPPDISTQFAFLPTGATTTVAIQNVMGVFTDENLGTVAVSVNGAPAQPINGLVSLDTTSSLFSAPVALAHGLNTVTVTATDAAGNTSFVTRNVTLDTQTPATFAVLAPADNSTITTGQMTVSGTVTDKAATVTLLGATVPVNQTDGTFSQSLTNMQSGLHSYLLEVTKGGATTAQKLAVDNNAATADIAITSPMADTAVGTASFTLSGKVAATNVSAVESSVDNSSFVPVTSFTPATGDFSVNVVTNDAAGSEANHVVKVRVTMTGGKTATAMRNILVDTKKPLFSIVAQSASAPSTLAGNVDPTARVQITASNSGVDVPFALTFDDYKAANNGSVWHATASGPYDTLRFTVTDPAGNVTAKTYTAGIPTGDISNDGRVRLDDAMICLRFVAKTQTPSTPEFNQADVAPFLNGQVNPNGEIDIFDCQKILRKALGLENW